MPHSVVVDVVTLESELMNLLGHGDSNDSEQAERTGLPKVTVWNLWLSIKMRNCPSRSEWGYRSNKKSD